jgi:hypothetical protein
VFSRPERRLRDGVVRRGRGDDDDGLATDVGHGLLDGRVGRGPFRRFAGRRVRVGEADEHDPGVAGDHVRPAPAPVAETGLDHTEDARSSPLVTPEGSPVSSHETSSGVNSTPAASAFARNSSPVLQPTSAKTSIGWFRT